MWMTYFWCNRFFFITLSLCNFYRKIEYKFKWMSTVQRMNAFWFLKVLKKYVIMKTTTVQINFFSDRKTIHQLDYSICLCYGHCMSLSCIWHFIIISLIIAAIKSVYIYWLWQLIVLTEVAPKSELHEIEVRKYGIYANIVCVFDIRVYM